MKAGRLDASFLIAPLAMKLREQGLPVKILYLGHRDGSEVMVRRDLPAASLRDLRGRVFAIPSIYSNQNLVIHKLMEDQGVKPNEIRFVEMAPPDMPKRWPPRRSMRISWVSPIARKPNWMAAAKCSTMPKTSGLTSSPACWW